MRNSNKQKKQQSSDMYKARNSITTSLKRRKGLDCKLVIFMILEMKSWCKKLHRN